MANSDLVEKIKEYPRAFPRVKTILDGKTITKQEYQAECDINTIVKSWMSSGVCPSVNAKVPLFVDCTLVKSFEQSANDLIAAQDAFMELDPKIRKQFNNSPVELVEFLADERNREEAIKLGLVDVPQASAVAPQGQAIGEASSVKLDEKKGA